VGGDTLTWSSLFYLLSHEGDRGKNFHHYPNNYFSHGCCEGQFGIYLKSDQEVFDGLEYVNKCITHCVNALDCLIRWDVRTAWDGNWKEADSE
jgi:hypothetical protein